MRCRCGEAMQPARVHFLSRLHGNGPRVLVSGLPAWECPGCGQQVTDSLVFQAVARLLDSGEVRGRRASAAG